MTEIHVVTFDPINGHSVGGFDWDLDETVIEGKFDEYVDQNRSGVSHRVRQWVTQVDDALTPDEITAHVDQTFVADDSEETPMRDSHLFTITSEGVERGDYGRDFIRASFFREEDPEASITLHQSSTDQPAINIEIDGVFRAEEDGVTGALRVHLNDWPIYISDVNDSGVTRSELLQYERVMAEQLDELRDALRHRA